MEFEVQQRDATARTGILSFEQSSLRTPAIFWYVSERISPPPLADFYLTQEGQQRLGLGHAGSFFWPLSRSGLSLPPSLVYPAALPEEFHQMAAAWNQEQAGEVQVVSASLPDRRASQATLCVLANARELFAHPRLFVSAITRVREAIGYQRVLYTPGLGLPHHVAVLAYCTVDVVDSIPLIEHSRRGYFLSVEGAAEAETLSETPCFCPACQQEDRSFSGLLSHNCYAAAAEIRRVRNAVARHRLRNLVEMRAAGNPHVASIVRIMDRRHYDFQERRYPVTGHSICASPYTLTRPDIERFRQRLVERYGKPPSARILLLLPCSARKPYSFSPSHRRFRQVIQACGNPGVVHEVMVTSPLGLVPRELELVYPAAHYDISVTGEWSRDEQVMLCTLLHRYLEHNPYDVIIQHVPSEIGDFLDLDAINTCQGHPTDSASLDRLSRVLKRETRAYDSLSGHSRRLDTVRAVLRYQFGEADSLLEGCTVKGRYPGYKIMADAHQIGMLVGERGLVSLTLEGGRRLAATGRYWVSIDDFVPRGSVFAVGVQDADPAIRAGDEVVVVYGEEVRAVGVASMNGEEMVESRRGEAVATRHHSGHSRRRA